MRMPFSAQNYYSDVAFWLMEIWFFACLREFLLKTYQKVFQKRQITPHSCHFHVK
jgi:hypothetical protein